MMDKTKKDLEEEKREKKCPISVDCWLMLLSDKILNEETKLFHSMNMALVIVLAFMSAAIVAFVSGAFTPFQSTAIGIYFLGVAFIVGFKKWRDYVQKAQIRLRHLRNIMEDIISGETDSNKICGKWEEYIKIEEDPEKIDSEKGVNEQKGNLQTPQNEVRDIKESLQEIKDTLKGSETFSTLSILGSCFIAIGILGISIGFALQYTGSYDSLLLLLVGLLIFSSGALMISSIEPDVEAFKKLLRYKKRFRLAALILLLAMLIIIFALFSIAIQIFF